MSVEFHPPGEMLIDYASGALREAQSLIVATHLALCWECRVTVTRCEAIGGTLLEQAGEVAVSSDCRQKMMAMLDEQTPKPVKPQYDPFLCSVLPAPLRGYVGCGIGEVKWEKYTSTVDRIMLKPSNCSSGKARLIRVKAGTALPKHTHTGHEYTLILSGTYSDEGGTYKRGDFVACDDQVTHSPKAGAGEECICLIVNDGAIQLTGLMGRLISPFLRF